MEMGIRDRETPARWFCAAPVEHSGSGVAKELPCSCFGSVRCIEQISLLCLREGCGKYSGRYGNVNGAQRQQLRKYNRTVWKEPRRKEAL